MKHIGLLFLIYATTALICDSMINTQNWGL